MTCGNPTTDADALMPRRTKYDKSKLCVKCKIAQGNLVIRHAVYCKECFFPLMTFKFRRALEPSVNPKPDGPRRTALKPTGDLLIGFSGGLGSTVLLDLVHRCYVSPDETAVPVEGGRDHPRKERVWKKVTVCYVETCDVFPGVRDRIPEVAGIVSDFDGVEFKALRIQDAFDPAWWKEVSAVPTLSGLGVGLADEQLPLINITSPTSPLDALRSFIASLPTTTSTYSAVQVLTRLLLLHTANAVGCSHLLLGTSLTSLAVSLISQVAQGAGFSIADERQEEWTPPSSPEEPHVDSGAEKGPKSRHAHTKRKRSVRVIRPLRDVGMKECTAWAWWKGLRVLGHEKSAHTIARQSIGGLTKDFIVGLEKDYPSTVSTIVRTCGKLAPKGESDGQCIFCGRAIQQGVQQWKDSISIRSQEPLPADRNPSDPALPSAPTIAPFLCYACHTTLTSRSSRGTPTLYPGLSRASSVSLPMWSSAGLQTVLASEGSEIFQRTRMRAEEMKGAIGDFLLEE